MDTTLSFSSFGLHTLAQPLPYSHRTAAQSRLSLLAAPAATVMPLLWLLITIFSSSQMVVDALKTRERELPENEGSSSLPYSPFSFPH